MAAHAREPPPETAARIADYMALDRRLLVGDIRRARPDIILVEKAPTDWEAWARADPEIAELLKPYSEVVTMNNVLVLKRESDGPERTGRETGRPADVR
jgi:predicted glycosyltransferase